MPRLPPREFSAPLSISTLYRRAPDRGAGPTHLITFLDQALNGVMASQRQNGAQFEMPPWESVVMLFRGSTAIVTRD